MTKKVSLIPQLPIEIPLIEEPKLSGGGIPETVEYNDTPYTKAFREMSEATKQLKRQKEAKRNMVKTDYRLQSKVLYEWIDRELRRIPQDKVKVWMSPTAELDFKKEEYPYTQGIDKLIKRFLRSPDGMLYDTFSYEHIDARSGNPKWIARFEVKHSEDGSVLLVSIWKW